MSERKAVIKNADMNEEMQQDAVDVATQAMEKYNIEKDIAAFIKREFDKKYNPTWHCIVGRNFGSYVTHETKVRGLLCFGLVWFEPCLFSGLFPYFVLMFLAWNKKHSHPRFLCLALHLLLPGPNRHPAVQVGLSGGTEPFNLGPPETLSLALAQQHFSRYHPLSPLINLLLSV